MFQLHPEIQALTHVVEGAIPFVLTQAYLDLLDADNQSSNKPTPTNKLGFTNAGTNPSTASGAPSRTNPTKPKQLVVIANSNLQAEYLHSTLRELLPQPHKIYLCPDWGTLAYDQLNPSPAVVAERISFLQQLALGKPGLYILSLQTALHRFAPREFICASTNYQLGDKHELDDIVDELVKLGYRAVEVVYEPGEFCAIGKTLDFYPVGANTAYRLNVFEGEIDRIRRLDVESQSVVEDVAGIGVRIGNEYPVDHAGRANFLENFAKYFQEVTLEANNVYSLVAEGIVAQGCQYYLPFFFKQPTNSIVDYIGTGTKVINFSDFQDIAQQFLRDNFTRYRDRKTSRSWPPLPLEELYLSSAQLIGQLQRKCELVTLEMHGTSLLRGFSQLTLALNAPDEQDPSQRELARKQLVRAYQALAARVDFHNRVIDGVKYDLRAFEKQYWQLVQEILATQVTLTNGFKTSAQIYSHYQVSPLVPLANLSVDALANVNFQQEKYRAERAQAEAKAQAAKAAQQARDFLHGKNPLLEATNQADPNLLTQADPEALTEEDALAQDLVAKAYKLLDDKQGKQKQSAGKAFEPGKGAHEQSTTPTVANLVNLGLDNFGRQIKGSLTDTALKQNLQAIKGLFAPHAGSNHQYHAFVDFIRKVKANFKYVQLAVTVANAGRMQAFAQVVEDLGFNWHWADVKSTARSQFDEFFGGKLVGANRKNQRGTEKIVTDRFYARFIISGLNSGFAYYDYERDTAFICLSEQDVLGSFTLQRRKAAASRQQHAHTLIQSLLDLKVNQLLVHQVHGICRFLGLETITLSEGQQADVFKLEFADVELALPVDEIHQVSIYSQQVYDEIDRSQLSSMSGRGKRKWISNKEKAQQAIQDMAADLLDIQSRRALEKGFRFELYEDDFKQFCDSFRYEETPDQFAAIQKVIGDMCAEQKMERLICGDVGFGKTEVAMRAAFIAVNNAKQVAVIVPTTLLAQQHYDSFRDRFAATGAVIEILSSFNSSAKQKKILNALEKGQIDIIIGTHSLLYPKVKFKDLGLLIIDEEHKFGVKQKEILKSTKAEIDVLTMTATPIPRTLNMALNGFRDISLINTPPSNRLPISTVLGPLDDPAMVRDAINREILRGGQVFFLHNDVATIEIKANQLRELVPHARVVVAHGQMPDAQIEEAMLSFHAQRYNVLVCSTIVETGIDIPNANTIIINNAHMFGIASLHQLRGRVGRSVRQAYCYMLTPRRLTDVQQHRLSIMTDIESLGAGYILATHDLEIRGAGEILGKEQSGKVDTIGYSLYVSMLRNAVKHLRRNKELTAENLLDQRTSIDLGVTAIIPHAYIPAANVRVYYYRQLSAAQTEVELDELANHMIDRFGPLPPATRILFMINKLKCRIADLDVESIRANRRQIIISFRSFDYVKSEAITELVSKHPNVYGYTKRSLQIKQTLTDPFQNLKALANLLTKVLDFNKLAEEEAQAQAKYLTKHTQAASTGAAQDAATEQAAKAAAEATQTSSSARTSTGATTSASVEATGVPKRYRRLLLDDHELKPTMLSDLETDLAALDSQAEASTPATGAQTPAKQAKTPAKQAKTELKAEEINRSANLSSKEQQRAAWAAKTVAKATKDSLQGGSLTAAQINSKANTKPQKQSNDNGTDAHPADLTNLDMIGSATSARVGSAADLATMAKHYVDRNAPVGARSQHRQFLDELDDDIMRDLYDYELAVAAEKVAEEDYLLGIITGSADKDTVAAKSIEILREQERIRQEVAQELADTNTKSVSASKAAATLASLKPEKPDHSDSLAELGGFDNALIVKYADGTVNKEDRYLARLKNKNRKAATSGLAQEQPKLGSFSAPAAHGIATGAGNLTADGFADEDFADKSFSEGFADEDFAADGFTQDGFTQDEFTQEEFTQEEFDQFGDELEKPLAKLDPERAARFANKDAGIDFKSPSTATRQASTGTTRASTTLTDAAGEAHRLRNLTSGTVKPGQQPGATPATTPTGATPAARSRAPAGAGAGAGAGRGPIRMSRNDSMIESLQKIAPPKRSGDTGESGYLSAIGDNLKTVQEKQRANPRAKPVVPTRRTGVGSGYRTRIQAYNDELEKRAEQAKQLEILREQYPELSESALKRKLTDLRLAGKAPKV